MDTPPPCKFFPQGLCKKTQCPFQHIYFSPAEPMQTNIDNNLPPCRFFLQGSCNKGSQCSFHHPQQTPLRTSTPLCKYFLQGSCQFGSQCTFSHDVTPCHNCGKRGHLAQDCTYIECRRCGKPGHLAQDCIYIECKNCGKPGHLQQDCTYIECRKCGKKGHIAKECTFIECKHCGKPGHLQKDCTNRECKKCGKKGHLAKDCTYIECRKCGKPGHLAKDCTYIECNKCGKPGHVRSECALKPPKPPRKPQVWRDSETGGVVSRGYVKIYPNLVANYERQLAKYNACVESAGNRGIHRESISVSSDVQDYNRNYVKARKQEQREDRERWAAMQEPSNTYVPSCRSCGECVGGGCRCAAERG